jgi:hypothetical protein
MYHNYFYTINTEYAASLDPARTPKKLGSVSTIENFSVHARTASLHGVGRTRVTTLVDKRPKWYHRLEGQHFTMTIGLEPRDLTGFECRVPD